LLHALGFPEIEASGLVLQWAAKRPHDLSWAPDSQLDTFSYRGRPGAPAKALTP